MVAASREAMKNAGPPKPVIEAVEVPEWGGMTYYVRAIDGEERDFFEASLVEEKTTKNAKGIKRTKRVASLDKIKSKLIVLCCCSGPDDPTPMFEPKDFEWLCKWSAVGAERIFLVAQRLAGLSQEDLDEIAGN